MSSTPQRIGPYRIEGVLGRGGMGVVYRGLDGDGHAVAVKTATVPHGALGAHLRREIRALARLDHPGVARMLGSGVDDGAPWYAMELLTGRTLRSVLDEQWSDPPLEVEAATMASPLGRLRAATIAFDRTPAAPREPGRRRVAPLEPVLELIRRLCRPLAYVHGHGIVHRDLKPENIFVRDPDNAPVIVDFGLAGSFAGPRAREELDRAGEVQGSYAYMAPEQIRGELVDARADLYALGCILYEATTGVPPFVGDAPAVMLHRQLFEVPKPPSQRARELAPALEALILGLLEKPAALRPGYAGDVAVVLAALLGVDEPADDATPYLYRPALAGRDRVVGELGGIVDDALSRRRGGCVFVAGESGVGKTRLVLEVARVAAQGGAEVVAAACQPRDRDAEGGAALAALRPLLVAVAERCRELGAQGVALLGIDAAVLAPYEPAVAALVPGQVAAPLPVRAAHQRLYRALRDALVALAAHRPLLLLVDDLQWADELSLGFLGELARGGLVGVEAAVLGTWRVDEIGAAALLDAPVVRLDRLDRAAAAAMAGDMLAARALPGWFIDELHERSGGNPFFLAEYLRTAVDHGVLRRGHGGQWQLDELRAARFGELPPPTSLLEVVRRRLDLLEPPVRAIAELAAVFGREVPTELLLASIAGDDAAAIDAIETLRVRAILDDAGVGRLRFAHDSIRESAYAAIPADAVRALHHRAGAALEAQPSSPTADPVIAGHFARALLHDKAADYFERAGDHAAALYANHEALAFYRAGSEQARHGGAAAVAARLDEKAGDLLTLIGRHDDARRAYAAALEVVASPIDRARLHRRAGASWQAEHRPEQALIAFAAAEAALPTPHDDAAWAEWIDVRLDHIDGLASLGHRGEMTAMVARVAPLIERAGPTQRCRFHYALALIEARRERYRPSPATVATMDQAVEAAERSGDGALRLAARFGAAAMRLDRGELEPARVALEAALDEASRQGALPVTTRCLTFLTIVHRRRGDLDAAHARAIAAARAARTSGLELYVGAADANLAWLAWRSGASRDETERLGQAALARWREHGGVFPFEWLARLPLLAIAERDDEIHSLAAPLLAPSQQALPEIEASLVRALEQREDKRDALAEILASAGVHGFL